VRTLLRDWPRVWQVLVVLTRTFVAPALPFRRRNAPSRPVRARAALERLGGAWVKLGQMLAMRFDLLPAPYCDELFKLLNRVEPFPYEQVREIVRRELGDVPEVVFRAFAPEPFAAASIGQVHRAVLPTGERVAVKVQRPRIRQDMRTDIDLMYAASRLLDWTHLFGATRSRAVIDEFARWTADELDYLVEARQAALLYDHAQGERLEQIPRVYREYTTSRVLTLELLAGIPLIEIVAAVREGNAPYLRTLATGGYDLDRVVRHLDWNMLNQVFVFGCFHADLHPANLLVLPGDAIGYVDFGQVGQLPADVRDSLTRYSWLLFQGDVEGAIRELMRSLAPTPATDAAATRQQLLRVHQAFLYRLGGAATGATAAASAAGNAGRGHRGAENPYSSLAAEIMETIRTHELALSPSLVAFLKMQVTIGTLRHQLAPTYDLPQTARRFFERMVRRQGAAWLDPRLALGRAYGGAFRARRALELVEFMEAQQPLLAAAGDAYFGTRRRLQAVGRNLMALGGGALVVAGALYFVLADPQHARATVPPQIPYTWVHVALLVVLVLLILALVSYSRRLTRDN
jgi:predicted unusual protein kinase regulating ubiquinone biosynthesis (AarF/ABC1/UbiB family)